MYFDSPSTVNDPFWYIDSGATDHMIVDLNNLAIYDNYKCKPMIYVGKGTCNPISQIGTSIILSHDNKSLLLALLMTTMLLLSFILTIVLLRTRI